MLEVGRKLFTLTLCAALSAAPPAVAHAQEAPPATVAGPVTGGERGGPFGGWGDEAPPGFVEQEWLLSGEATSHRRANTWETDGQWEVATDEVEPFTVRLLVRRPGDASRFNGVVVVEWLNVTARAEGAADYMQMAEEIVRGGYTWVGIGAQAVGIHAELPRGPGCADPVNTAPHHAFVKAGLRALTEWVRSSRVPPQSPEIRLRDASATDPVERDARGNALGGIRIPQLEAPTATLDGRQNSLAASGPDGQNFCFLYGNTRPFDEATLAELYPTHDAFVRRFVAAVDALERDGYLLAPEAAEARQAAAAAGIGR